MLKSLGNSVLTTAEVFSSQNCMSNGMVKKGVFSNGGAPWMFCEAVQVMFKCWDNHKTHCNNCEGASICLLSCTNGCRKCNLHKYWDG